jgi:hypothetical protein
MVKKVFVSHASEDKDRFVLEFASRLRAKGVDAWLDRWEMLPGDSRIEKIFAEGLSQAAAVVVVLSRNSVEKPWVQRELEVALVNQINKQAKLIPVRLDNISVPEALKSTLWEAYSGPNDMERVVARVTSAVHGAYEKPPIGAEPSYVTAAALTYQPSGLAKVDSLVLNWACEIACNRSERMVSTGPIVQRAQELGFTRDQVADAIEILEHHAYLERSREVASFPRAVILRDAAIVEFFASTHAGYDGLESSIFFDIANGDATTAQDITSAHDIPGVVVESLLGVLDAQGLITYTRFVGGGRVGKVSPMFKRRLS